MQDILTLAAEITGSTLIAFCTVGYLAYVWKRTAPTPVAAIPTPAAAVEPIAAPTPVPPVEPIFTADAPATPTVKRCRQVSPPVQEVIDHALAEAPKRKRGRPRKEAA